MEVTDAKRSLPQMEIRKAKKPSRDALAEDARLKAFEMYFQEYWAAIYRLLKRMVGDPAEAEDLALEAMYRLHQRQAQLEPDSNVGGWLFRVASNLGLHSIRSAQRRMRHEAAAGRAILDESPEDRPAEIAAREEERRLARQALAEMDPRRAELLVMRYSGMPYKEIAVALNLSPTSIGPLLVRAEREFVEHYRRLTQEEL
ncbi:MAG: sigma-70 family RNA polymerase sigma factor [Anaerolineae bacterium]